MLIDLVISHYSSESLEWLLKLPRFNRIWIYSKGTIVPKTPSGNNIIFQRLPNVGREGHTYLEHMVRNYDNIPDAIVFTVDTVDHHSDRWSKLLMVMNHLPYTFFPTLKHENTTFHQGFSIKKYGDVNLTLAEPRPYGKWYRKWIKNTLAHLKKHGWSYNGIFGVRGKDITKYPQSYYQRIMDSLSSGDSVEAGHYLERSWRTMWTS